jgi:hypothetical protein
MAESNIITFSGNVAGAIAHEVAFDTSGYCGWVRVALEFWRYGRDEKHVEEGEP